MSREGRGLSRNDAGTRGRGQGEDDPRQAKSMAGVLLHQSARLAANLDSRKCTFATSVAEFASGAFVHSTLGSSSFSAPGYPPRGLRSRIQALELLLYAPYHRLRLAFRRRTVTRTQE